MRDIVYERTRSESQDSPNNPSTCEYFRFIDDSKIGSWSEPWYEDKYSNTTYDTETPRFHQRKKRGEIVCTDYQNVKVTSHTDRHYYYWRAGERTTAGQKVYGSYYQGLRPDTLITGGTYEPTINFNLDYEVDKLLTSVHADVSAAPMQALVTIAELRKSVDLIADSLELCNSAFRFLKSLKSSQVRALTRDAVTRSLRSKRFWKKIPGSVGNQWLQYRYGFRQLYYDYRSSMKAVQRAGKATRERYTKTGVFPLTATESYWNTIPGAWQTQCTAHRRRDITISAGILVKPRTSEVSQLQAFGLDEVLQGAWELTKFSFVVDWFINAGEKLAAFAPKGDVRVLTSWVVVREDDKTSRHYDGVWNSDHRNLVYGQVKDDDLQATVGDEWTRRQSTTRYANPAVNPIPNWDMNLSVGKIADLLSLTHQLFAGASFDKMRV